ncbi:MAG: hypothetical protein AB1724_18810 [Thermodesulfobacteriota bacterium]
MNIYIVCLACREALALEWDPVFYAADDPLAGGDITDFEAVEGAITFGLWPTGEAPCPLAAGAWATLAARSLAFFRRHTRHPDQLDIFITRELPEGVTLVSEEPFIFPAPSPDAEPPVAIGPSWVRSWPVEQRLSTAAVIGETGLWEKAEGPEDQVPDALLLMGWLPPDEQIDKRLLALVMDIERGPAAEEALALRLVLNIVDVELRRKRLLEIAVNAYARRFRFSAGVRPTPYDHMARLDLIQAAAVRRLVVAGLIDQACDLALQCRLAGDRMDLLRKALSDRILDRALPAETRLRHVWNSQRIFPGLVGELRRERGLAVDPLPSPLKWPGVLDQDRSLASLTVAPSAIRVGLISTDVTEVITALEVIRILAFVAPEEAAAFAADVLPLCRDKRTEPPPVATRLCARARDVHSLLFAVPGTGSWEDLTEVIEAMLSAGLGVSLGMHFRSLAANEIPVERVGDLLVTGVADRSRPVKERLQAREALSKLATDAAAASHNQPRPSPEGQAAARRADDLLIAALNDPAEPEEFKTAIRDALTRWMPDRLAELRSTVVQRASVPSITDLVPGQSIAGIEKEEVLALLRDPDADLGRVLSAIALSESFIRMKPDLAVAFEPLLREKIADIRRYNDRARNLTVAWEASSAHRAVWQQMKPDQRPAATDLLVSLNRIAAAQAEPAWPGEDTYAAKLAETIRGYLSPEDEAAIGAGLEKIIAGRRIRAWTRLHAYHAMIMLINQGDRARRALFAALADPGEDPVLRSEAHALLAPRLPQPVFELQAKGILPRPAIPPVESLFHNLPMYDRDTEGEWLLTPAAIRLAGLVYPDDLTAALSAAGQDPSRACAAAALASPVGERLPAAAQQFAALLRGLLESKVEIHAVIAGRQKSFRLAALSAAALSALKM